MKITKPLAVRPYLTVALVVSSFQFNSQLYAASPNVNQVSHDPDELNNPELSLQNEKVADKVLAVILSHSLTRDIDAESVNELQSSESLQGCSELRQKLLQIIQKSQPLTFTLVGFPFKSGNKETKVIGDLPDLAERLALEKLHKFMEEIGQVYAYGAKIIIYTDGLAFFDQLDVPLEKVTGYETALKQLAADLPLISIMTCQDLFPDLSPEVIHANIKSHPMSFKELSSEAKDVLSKRLLMEFDFPKGRVFLKERSFDQITTELDRRSQQINQIYKSKFPSAIPLSVHYKKDIGEKVGISLSEGHVTPWHGVAVLKKGGSFIIIPKKDVPTSAQISSKRINGINCYYYIY
ncbi:MAG: isocyanide synthase family protein [Alphaproteobacteria bacterium]|nr:isocyanide synthase family protein [Alphaproteobacteria bacterium]